MNMSLRTRFSDNNVVIKKDTYALTGIIMENMHIDRDVNDFISCPPFLISDFIMHKHVLICNRKSYTKK